MQIGKYIANVLKKESKIAETNCEVIQYGINQTCLMLVNIISTISIGLAMNVVLESICFQIGFIVLRVFAGGVHAKSPIRCYIYSMLIIWIGFYMIGKYNLFGIMEIIGFGLAVLVIHQWAPLGTENKALDYEEIKRYGRYTKKVLGVETIILMGAMILKISWIAEGLLVAILLVGILVCCGKVQFCLRNKVRRGVQNADE